ncbi:MAG TPA: delta-60 repeat domain-containing protein, partial [Pyrinomonadaceae bacterium]|nr:delta-60 repeat domain-containing protein [Pyrinomonadaceae bacterium]
MKSTPTRRRLFSYVLISALTLFAISSAYVRPADSASDQRQPGGALAVPGDLDPAFDADGRVVTPFPNGLDAAEDVAVQADGKVVVAGGSGTDFAIARYNTDGSLDGTFGKGGRVNTDFPVGQGGFASALVIQPDGKIVLAGSANDPTETFASAFALARYNSDGSLDTSFDSDGLVITSFPGTTSNASGLALQPDGKLVAAGTSRNFTTISSVFAVARYNTDGSLDTSFDGDGRATIDIAGASFEEAYGVGVQADGRIVQVGLGNSAFAVARYNTNGSPDTTFDMDGQVTTDFGGSFEQASAVAFQMDGRIVVAGELATSTAADDNFALARYNTDGSLDNTFDGDGKVITDFGLVDGARDVVIQPDGRIVAAGRAGTIPTGTFFAVARYNTTGALDTSFDTDGKVLTDVSGGRFNLGGRGV